MADELIPEDIQQFILAKIDSVAELEGLLLLRGNPHTEWSVEALAQRLYTSRQQTSEVLAHLHAGGFLAAAGDPASAYRYHPATPKLGQMVERVAEVYSKYLVSVTNLIHAKPKARAQKFADAFKLRRGKD
ncbi:MAG: hypothetical protein ACRD9R_07620 [Pyrinomonadaceae bacterium]